MGAGMWIIDRYLLRQFLKTFLICYISLTGLYIVIDAFTFLEEFLRCAEKGGNLLSLLGTYYAYRAVWFFDRTAALLTLISAMFTCTWIQRHNELIALLAAGISRIRVIAPVFWASLLVILVAAANRELILPKFRGELGKRPRDLAGSVGRPIQFRYDNQTDILIRGSQAFLDRQVVDRPNFLLPVPLREYGSQLIAREAIYHFREKARPAGYLLRGVEQPRDLDNQRSLYLNGRLVVITRNDAPDWLAAGECFVVSDVTITHLIEDDESARLASLGEMIRALRNSDGDYQPKVRVAIHSRLVQPLLDATLLCLGLPLVVTRHSRNVFVAIGLCAAVVALFLLVVLACQWLGFGTLISPSLAAWAPLMIFAPMSVYAVESMWQ
jgi:lipopolysaccharide export system permease protein